MSTVRHAVHQPLLAAVAAAAVLVAASGAVADGRLDLGGHLGLPLAPHAQARSAADAMPTAPRTASAWLAEVDRIYRTTAGGRGAEAWLRQRSARRVPGQRLAVVLGLDDVMVQTHFGGPGVVVPASVRFARTAHRLGYAVFYDTGRHPGPALTRIQAALRHAGAPVDGVYGRPAGAASLEVAKARARARVVAQGYTLAVSVAASEASFDGSPTPELEIRLPDFGAAPAGAV